MSEKRFKGYAEKTGQHFELIINDLLGEEYSLTDDFFKSKDVIFEIVDLLNVMNDTLLKQAEQNHKLSNKNIEQQATIQSLKEENEQLQKWNEYYKKELIKPIDLNKLKYKHLVGNPVVRFTEEQKKELISKFEKFEKGDG